ncbi:hypothetical protein IVA80_14260 [Bradyrhizobium sp. 139]|uniref:hypothetical protein n=1 Tax=Bradyrhizobium sp. 139 TaxID=2782616 RepID=UPI001FFA6C7F|nr:hypothetical protein [Bradyrhizobium sp. 139]MCK1742006.1 hypothetical protein [Bradyrhizobium sp. 139]
MSIVYQQMPEGTVLDAVMPDWVKLSIADCIIVFGRIEQKMVEIAWDLAGTTEVKDRVKRARVPAADNFDELLSVIEEAAGQKFDALRESFTKLAHDRNLIAHGHWLMAGGKPYVVWHKFLTDTHSVMGEFFEEHRFHYFKTCGDKLHETCNRWHDMITEGQGKTAGILERIPDSSQT